MRTTHRRAGFTLLEVIMVLVLIAIITGISVPYFAGSLRGMKLQTAARAIERVSRYTRCMAILREETLTMAIDPETMILFMGGPVQTSTNAADGEIDQEVLKRLYFDGAGRRDGGIDKELTRQLPDGLTIKDFEKEQTEEDDAYPDLHLVHFYPNGQSDWFKMEIEDTKGHSILLEIDPISGKIRSEFLQ